MFCFLLSKTFADIGAIPATPHHYAPQSDISVSLPAKKQNKKYNCSHNSPANLTLWLSSIEMLSKLAYSCA